MKNLEVKSNNHFRQIKKQDILPKNFPLNPEKYFNDIWSENGGWAGFLGTNNKSSKVKNYISFEVLKNYLKDFKLSSKDKYAVFVREQKFVLNEHDLPSAPNTVYKSEWKGWADFLGKEEK